jgi:hypothetical protein
MAVRFEFNSVVLRFCSGVEAAVPATIADGRRVWAKICCNSATLNAELTSDSDGTGYE